MNDRGSVLGLITARGGSKSVPGKNLQTLGGKPLIAWVIEAALASKRVDRLVLSSDDPKIIAAAKELGCEAPFVRPSHLATDHARSIDVVHHALATLPETYDFVAMIQPTSPFVAPEDIDGCIERCGTTGAPACVTITLADKHPAWMYRLSPNQELEPITDHGARPPRRQDLPLVYALNGAVFAARCDWLADQDDFVRPETVGFEMPRPRSNDIDTEFDFFLAEAMLEVGAIGTN